MDNPGSAGHTNMFSKQNQPNVDEARDAVKKQLLRSLMHQVIEEVSSSDELQLKEMIESLVADLDVTSMRQRIDTMVQTAIGAKFEGLDLEAQVSQKSQDMKAAFEEEMKAKVEAISNQVTQSLESDITERIQTASKSAVASFDERISSRIEDAQLKLERQVDTYVDKEVNRVKKALISELDLKVKERLESSVSVKEISLEEIVAQFSADRFEEISTSTKWTETMDAATNDLQSGVLSQLKQKFQVETEAVFTDSLRNLDVELKETVQSLIPQHIERILSADEWAHNITDAREQVRTDLLKSIVGQLVSDKSLSSDVVDGAVQSFLKDSDWNDSVSERVTNEVTAQLGKEVQKIISGSDAVILDVVERMRNESDIFNATASRVHNELIEQVAKLSIAKLDDVDRIAKEARDHIAFDNDTLIAAATMLRTKVLQDIARRTTLSLGSSDDVSSEALKWISEEDPYVAQAVADVVGAAHEVVATLARQQISDVDFVVSRVVPEFTAETEQIKNAVKATRKKLIDKIGEFTIDELRSVEKVSGEAAAAIPDDHDAIKDAVSSTMALLLDDVVRISETRLKLTEKVSSDARARMDDDIPEVRQAADILENMLLSEVANRATERLYEVERASEKAREFFDVENKIQAVEKQLHSQILQEIAEKAINRLDDVSASSQDAFKHIDVEHDYFKGAVTQLRSRLINEIASKASASIEDVEAVAKESRKLISINNDSPLIGATTRLYDMLVDDVARQTLTLISESEKTASDAFARVESENEVIKRVREIVHDRMIESLLASALEEIGDSISDTSDKAERSFFRNAVSLLTKREPTSAQILKKADSSPEPKEEVPEAVMPEPESETDRVYWTPLSEIEEVKTEAPVSDEKPWFVSEYRPDVGDGATPNVDYSGKSGKSSTVLYVYGIVNSEQDERNIFDGIEGLEEGSTVYSLGCGNLTAIVSELSDPAFCPAAIRSAMRDTDWLRDQVRQHAGVLAEAKGFMTIVPLRFGCVYNDKKAVIQFVKDRQDVLSETLTRLQDKSEFGIRVACDIEVLENNCNSSNTNFDASLKDVSLGVAEFVRGQMLFGDDSSQEAAMDALQANFSARIHDALGKISSEFMRKPALLAKAPEDQDVIMNATYLVPVVDEKNFKARVAQLAKEFAHHGVTIELSGPWPPYHFVNIEMNGSESIPQSEIPV